MDSINRHRLGSAISMADIGDGVSRKRDSLFLLSRMRLGDSPDWAEVRVRNLSSGGLMVELAEPLAIGAPVELELRGVGLVAGRIAWQAEGRAGIAFDTPIDPMKARKPVGTRNDNPPYAKVFTPGR